MASRKNANASLGKTVKPSLAIGFIRNGKKTEKGECYVATNGDSFLFPHLPTNDVSSFSLMFQDTNPKTSIANSFKLQTNDKLIVNNHNYNKY